MSQSRQLQRESTCLNEYSAAPGEFRLVLDEGGVVDADVRGTENTYSSTSLRRRVAHELHATLDSQPDTAHYTDCPSIAVFGIVAIEIGSVTDRHGCQSTLALTITPSLRKDVINRFRHTLMWRTPPLRSVATFSVKLLSEIVSRSESTRAATPLSPRFP